MLFWTVFRTLPYTFSARCSPFCPEDFARNDSTVKPLLNRIPMHWKIIKFKDTSLFHIKDTENFNIHATEFIDWLKYVLAFWVYWPVLGGSPVRHGYTRWCLSRVCHIPAPERRKLYPTSIPYPWVLYSRNYLIINTRGYKICFGFNTVDTYGRHSKKIPVVIPVVPVASDPR